MKFSVHDILSCLIPGSIMLGILLYLFPHSYDKDLTVAYTLIAFMLGYLINGLSHLLEGFYYLTWGGKPSDILFQGKSCGRIRFMEYEWTKTLLTREFNRTVIEPKKPINGELFSTAFRCVKNAKNPNPLIHEYNAQYVFSRNILTIAIIAINLLLIIYIYKHFSLSHCNICLFNHERWVFNNEGPALLGMSAILWMIWHRAKQRAYYFAKEVLSTYLSIYNQ